MNGLVEKRRHPRRRHDAAETVTGRIRAGLPIRVVDLSEGGGLIETAARLRPGASVELYLESPLWRARVRARVIRCEVGSLAPARITFQGALEFDAPLTTAGAMVSRTSLSAATAICREVGTPYGDDPGDVDRKR
jgi:hypothetical protein